MSTDRPHATLPSFLRPETVGTMPLDEPRYLRPDQFRPGTEDSVVVCGYEELDKRNRKLDRLRGRVALMLTTSRDYSEEGYLADFRMLDDHETIAPGEDFTDGILDEEEEDEELDCEHPIRALVARDPRTGEIEISGDVSFLPALSHLTEIVNKKWEKLSSKQVAKQPASHSGTPSVTQPTKK